MSSDIKLEEDFVVTEGNALKVNAWDLMLDGPGRRGGAGGDYRRALVHSDGDKLTINFNKDYTGGVKIQGPLSVTDDVGLEGSLSVKEIIISKDEISQGIRERWHTIIQQDNIKITHISSGQGSAVGYEIDLLKVSKEGNIGIHGSLSVKDDVTCQDLRASSKVYGGGELIIGDPDAIISETISDRPFLSNQIMPGGEIFAISISANEISYWETMYMLADWQQPSFQVRYYTRTRQPIKNLKLIETIKDLQGRIAKLEKKVFGS